MEIDKRYHSKIFKLKKNKTNCPICKKKTTEKYTPFCSKKCSDLDLIQWLTDQNHINSKYE
tara:strand:- start:111 stop:293 length:183 start_codon:yes stop_codon:yes gene_type:complete